MKDRQPTQVLANGAIRYGIYNADGTLARYEYMKREDAPTVEGTPLNKANLLSDATEAKIWRGDDKPEEPTVNDALNKLADGTAKIGDIEITARTDLSAAWLRCNGIGITQTQYPELYSVLRTSASPQPFSVKSDPIGFENMWFINGEWLGIKLNSSTGLRTVYTSPDLTAWTQRATIPFAFESVRYAITHNDGTYYLAEVSFSGDTAYLSSVDQLDGTWTRIASCTLYLYSAYQNYEDYNVCVYFSKNVMYIRTEVSTLIGNPTSVYNGIEAFWLFWTKGTSSLSSYSATRAVSGTILYDETLDLFYNVGMLPGSYGAKARIQKCTSLQNPAWELVSEISLETLAPTDKSNYKVFLPCVARMSGTTILAFFQCKYGSVVSDGGCITYVYSMDRGATWQAGNIVSRGTASTIRQPDLASVFNDGLFATMFNVSEDGSTYTFKILAISDLAATPVFLDYFTSSGTLPEVPNGNQIAYSCGAGIMSCDFSNKVKALPTITPDARSHAYIKALEE